MSDQKPHKKTPFEALRRWYGRKVKSVAQSESQDSPAQVDDFLAYQTPAEFRQTTQNQPHVQAASGIESDRSPLIVAELDTTPFASTISLESTLSHDSATGMVQPTPQPHPSLPRPQARLWGPDDFEQFRSDLHGLTELESIPAMPKQQPRPQHKSFAIESTPDLVGQAQPKPAFKAFVAANEAGPQSFQAYPGAPNRKPVGPYVHPKLQPGYVNGLPPVLSARHSSANLVPPQNNSDPTAAPTGHSYPLVDFRQGLFLNANMSDVNISTRYQEPRIPSIRFPSRGLEAEVNSELTRLRMPDEKEVSVERPRMRPKMRISREREIVRPKSRAWMSPSSPLHSSAYELEASGIPLQRATAVSIRPQTHRIVEVSRRPELDTLSPVSPPSSTSGTVKYSEYNWPRFSDNTYTDPATEYSQRYRDRRREYRGERDRSPG